jgi:Fic family protein
VLGNLVEPFGHPHKSFRNGEVIIGEVQPPSYDKVPYLIRDLVDDLNTIQVHPIIRASHAHIELVKIHPYNDGNGRTGRLLQTYCLDQKGYPPAVIPESDRDIYTALLRRTLKDRVDKKSSIIEQSDNERLFHSFIAAKVLESAEKLDQELQKRRMYAIEFWNGYSIKTIIASAKRLRSSGRKYGGMSVNIESARSGRKKNGTKLVITGNVSREQIEEIMEKCRQDYAYKYKIISNPY